MGVAVYRDYISLPVVALTVSWRYCPVLFRENAQVGVVFEFF
jgi:hypothetical protein